MASNTPNPDAAQAAAVPFRALLQHRLYGTRGGKLAQEFAANSGHLPILKLVSSLFLSGGDLHHFDGADGLLLVTAFLQAAYLSRDRAHRFWGNLICPALYTLLDLPLDGLEDFLADPFHWLLWVLAIAIAMLQMVRDRLGSERGRFTLGGEAIARSIAIPLFYITFQISFADNPAEIFHQFLPLATAPTSAFLLVSTTAIGALFGLQAMQLDRQSQEMRRATDLLSDLAEWGMGNHAVATVLQNPDSRAFDRRDRSFVFLDVRQFTAWCETHSPDRVAALLDEYYNAIEPAAAAENPLRIAFAGDELMAIYASPERALAAALAVRRAATNALAPYGLGAGCGLHCGRVVEGLFGSGNTRTYTAFGDAVNTAKRIESHTPAGQVCLSDAMRRAALDADLLRDRDLEALPPVAVKGKTQPLTLWRIVGDPTRDRGPR